MLPEFGIWPKDGSGFDVSGIISQLKHQQTVLEVPAEQGARYTRPHMPEFVYVVCPTTERVARVADWVRAGNSVEKFVASCGIVEPTPQYISVHQMAPDEVVRKIADILLPFLRRTNWRIYSEDGDVTAAYEQNPEKLFD